MIGPTLLAVSDRQTSVFEQISLPDWNRVELEDTAEVISVLRAAQIREALIVASPRTSVAELAAITHASTQAGTRIGFVVTWTGPESVSAQLGKLASWPGPIHASTLAWSHFGFGGLPAGIFGPTRLLAPNEQNLLDPLAEGHRLVGLASHGNGIDGPLGGAVACAVASNRVVPDDRYFPCGRGGPCLRATAANGHLVPPDRVSLANVRAEALVFQTCWGLLAHDAIFAPEYSLARDILAAPGVGALLTTYKTTMMADTALLYALALIRAGRSLGETCLRLNQMEMACGGPPSWLLVGDPTRRLWPARSPAGHTIDAGVAAPGRPFTVEPGGIRLIDLPGPMTQLITFDPIAGGSDPGTGGGALRRVPGTHHGVIINASAEPMTGTVMAHTERNAVRPAATITAIWDSVAPLAFTSRFLELAAANPKSSRCRVPSDLVKSLHATVNYHLRATAVGDPGHAVLDGPLRRLNDLAAAEQAHWQQLHRQLCEYLALYCRTVGAVLEYTYGETSRGLTRPPEKTLCPYCRSPTDTTDVTVPLTGHRRRRTWCYRCALVSDTSSDRYALRLDGPDQCKPGDLVSYQLQGTRPQAETLPRHLTARLTFAHTPWDMGPGGDLAEFEITDGRPLELSLQLPVPRDAPPGVYFIAAAIAAHGDLWVARRPIEVLRAHRG